MIKNRFTRRMIAGVLALAVLLAMGGMALAAGGEAIGWWVISGSGGPASGGNVTVNTTLGQPVAGTSSGGSIGLEAGYWYGNVLAAGGPAIDWWVLSNAGTLAAGGNVTLNDTLGQSFTGPAALGDVGLGAGYWTGVSDSSPTAVTLLAFSAHPAPVAWGVGLLLVVGAAGWWSVKRR